MIYLLLGFAMGTFVSGLITKFYTNEPTLVPSKYLFGLSMLFLLLAGCMSWGGF